MAAHDVVEMVDLRWAWLRTLFSPSWYRVAQLRPSLRKQVVVYRHTYRGKPWHVIEERSSEQHHRFKPATYFIVGLMDGTRTVDAIWRAALDRLGDEARSSGRHDCSPGAAALR